MSKPGQFKKGQDPRRNIEGRPVGSKNFTTDFDEVVEDIAKANGITKSEARKILLKVAFTQAKGGNYNFWKEIIDRYYGKTPEEFNGEILLKIAKEVADKHEINNSTSTNSI
jgi:hypothetical protein